MKRIASILTGFSLAVLFFVGSAHAQYIGEPLVANIPFEFNVGKVAFPPGQYEFRRSSNENLFQIRDAYGHTLFTVSSGWNPVTPGRESSVLKFAVVDGRHTLIQIWDVQNAVASEFQYDNRYAELSSQPVLAGPVSNQR
jgi:hypothetical protein